MAQAVDRTGPAAERTDAGQAVTATAAEPSSADPPARPRPPVPLPATTTARPRLPRSPGRAPGSAADPDTAAPKPPALPSDTVQAPGIELPDDDPLAGYLMKVSGAVDIRELEFSSRPWPR